MKKLCGQRGIEPLAVYRDMPLSLDYININIITNEGFQPR